MRTDFDTCAKRPLAKRLVGETTGYLDSVISLKWLFFSFGIPKKFQEHDILTFSLFLIHVNNQDLIHTLHWALGIEQ